MARYSAAACGAGDGAAGPLWGDGEAEEAGAPAQPAHEVPGAIFSQPIVRQEPAPLVSEPAPAAGPRTPVLPVLEDDEDDLPAPSSPRAADAKARRRRVLALHALRQLRRAADAR